MLILKYSRLALAVGWTVALAGCPNDDASSGGEGADVSGAMDGAAGSRLTGDPAVGGAKDAAGGNGDNGSRDGEAAADLAGVPDRGGADDPGSGSAAARRCDTDGDCRLVNDCCTCEAVSTRDREAYCGSQIACLVSACAQYGEIDGARCVARRCVLGFDCDTARITCKRLAPACPSGQVPRVLARGGDRCYGECVDAGQCLSVPSCKACGTEDVCVRSELKVSSTFHCIDR
jgi:hypothetical protein